MTDQTKDQFEECAMCGEAHANHRPASGNSAAFCMSPRSRPGDTFVRQPPPTCPSCRQPMQFVREGVYQCLTGEHSRHSCPLFGIGHDADGRRLPHDGVAQ
jgi:hypothetical protein